MEGRLSLMPCARCGLWSSRFVWRCSSLRASESRDSDSRGRSRSRERVLLLNGARIERRHLYPDPADPSRRWWLTCSPTCPLEELQYCINEVEEVVLRELGVLREAVANIAAAGDLQPRG